MGVGRQPGQTEAHRVGTKLIDHFDRVDSIPFTLGHGFTQPVENFGMDIDFLERDFSHVVQPHQYHAGYPQSNNVARCNQRAGGIEIVQFLGFLRPSQRAMWPQRAAEPRIQDIRILYKSHRFDLPLGRFMSKVIGIHFYESGALKSLTLWPGEKIVLKTPVGLMRVRTGFSLYEDGSLKTVEPAQPMRIDTSIGSVLAFDAEMVGMHADQNSVQFAPNGELLSLKTVHTGVRVQAGDAAEVVMEPLETTSLIDMEEMRTVPMQVDFSADAVRIAGVTEQVFDRSECVFSTFERSQVLRSACASCAGCSGAEACCTS